MAKKTKEAFKKDHIIIVFKYVNVNVDCNPDDFDEEASERVKEIVDHFSTEIWIDRTQVDYPGTKYKKTFITEDGWSVITDLLQKTKYGKKASKEDNEILHEIYRSMAIQYLFQCLEDFDYNIENICLEIPESNQFIVEIHEDNYVDNYPGEWQTWEN